jgi:hypothetical protein
MLYGEEKPPLEDLVHFGVKGMHWGVRKQPVQLSNETRVIKKGQSFQNVSAGKVPSLDRRVFTSHTVKDNLAYRSTYAKGLKILSDGQATYVNTITPKRNLKVGSEKQAFDAFKKLYEADKPGMIRAIADSYEELSRTMLFLGDVKDQKIADQNFKSFSKKGEDWLNKRGYDIFLTGAGTAHIDKKLADSYYTSLARQGLDAIVDQVDKKAKLGDDPIIILEPKKTAKLTSSIPLSENDIKIAGKKYKEEKRKQKKEAKANR